MTVVAEKVSEMNRQFETRASKGYSMPCRTWSAHRKVPGLQWVGRSKQRDRTVCDLYSVPWKWTMQSIQVKDAPRHWLR